MSKDILCNIKLCDRNAYCKKMCNRHYLQMQRHGKILEKTVYDPRPAVTEGDIAKIPLGLTEKFALVDKKYSYLDKYMWSLGTNGYPNARVGDKRVLLHRLLMDEPACMVDHINNDRLDNRMSNLRLCNSQQNSGNSSLSKRNKTGFKGVYPHRGRWMARLANMYLGMFDTKVEAAKAYNIHAAKRFGEFAKLNVFSKESKEN